MKSYLAAFTAAGLVSAGAVTAPLITLAGLVAAALFWLGWKAPRVALVAWLVVGAAVPYWLAIPAGVVIPPLTAASLPIIGGLALRVQRWTFTAVDALVLLLITMATITAALAGAELASAKDVFLVWGSAYLIGRLFGLRVDREFFARAYIVTGIVVALWAVVEFAFGLHVFEDVKGPVHDINFWNQIQVRGAFDRSEGAFGHSICLGAFLVTVIPFVLRTRRPLLGWAIISLGIVVSLSRAGFIGLAAAVALCLFVYGMNRWLFIVSLLGTLGAVLYAPDILFGADDAAAQQIGWSTNYREYLWETGFAQIQAFGPSGMYFRTVDQAFLRVGLDMGWVVFVLFAVLALIPVARVFLRRTKEPAELALTASFPILMTVALLLQWQSFLWMLGGLAASYALSGRPAEEADLPDKLGSRDAECSTVRHGQLVARPVR